MALLYCGAMLHNAACNQAASSPIWITRELRLRRRKNVKQLTGNSAPLPNGGKLPQTRQKLGELIHNSHSNDAENRNWICLSAFVPRERIFAVFSRTKGLEQENQFS